jgi:hypothetical protein
MYTSACSLRSYSFLKSTGEETQITFLKVVSAVLDFNYNQISDKRVYLSQSFRQLFWKRDIFISGKKCTFPFGVLYEVAAPTCKFDVSFFILLTALLETPVLDTTRSCTFMTGIICLCWSAAFCTNCSTFVTMLQRGTKDTALTAKTHWSMCTWLRTLSRLVTSA